ncbi:MAG TPA: histidine kinase dimerization/phosphoacceptor domain -containing protein, partial [Bacteroidota bacterium]|nr:histidine kinase dimerization/phosphoacceptor domain -containing protein [Bacteroidota bacterium]
DNMMDMVVQVDTEMRFRYVSPSHERVLGYRPEELLGTFAPELMHPDEREDAVRQLRAMLRMGVGSLQFRCRRKQGDYIWLDATGRSFVGEGGTYVGAVIATRDITEKRSAEEGLKNTLKEKEILVREVLHRVKNNLNLVASLLNIQSGYAVDPKDSSLFQEARNRIIAMSRIHEKLYHSASLAELDFRGYVKEVVGGLSDAYGTQNVALHLEVDAFDLDLDKAIPLGLIINELVTNCYKYAFPAGKKGEVVVLIQRLGRGSTLLSVRDNGVGLPEGIDLKNPESLGLSLVVMLAAQIGAQLEVERGNGTGFVVSIPD